MIYVYPKLRRAGLGNLLFDWAYAEVCAKKHNLKVLNPKWVHLTKLGVWVRAERYKRWYGGAFTKNGFVTGFKRYLISLMYPTIDETSIGRVKFGKVVYTASVDKWFNGLIEQRSFLKQRLYEIVNPNLLAKIHFTEPFVGVHVRRGDFCLSKLKTADDWFVDALKNACANPAARSCECIRVFSDDYPENLTYISRAFPRMKVVIMPKAPAIQDILSLSQASVLVGSPRSTFSMWAAFLGQMPSYWSSMYESPRLYENEQGKLFYVKEVR